MKRKLMAICLGMIFWSNPTYYLPTYEPISEYDRQEIVAHFFIGDGMFGPWTAFVDVPYGQELWDGYIPPEKWITGYATLYDMKSDWAAPMYSGDPPPSPEPDPTPEEPPKRGKGWGKGGKPKK